MSFCVLENHVSTLVPLSDMHVACASLNEPLSGCVLFKICISGFVLNVYEMYECVCVCVCVCLFVIPGRSFPLGCLDAELK